MMNRKWEMFEVGLKRGEWLDVPQGMVMDWSDEYGLTLFVYHDKPSREEIRDLSAGSRFEIAFKDIDGIGFFAIKFGSQPWFDCGYSPNFYSTAPRFDEPKEGKTYELNVMFVDVSVGELKVLRTISLGSDFTKHFRKWCLESLGKNIGQLHYNRVIDKAFEEYPTAESLAMKADVRWVYAHGEDEQKREEKIREWEKE